jgi:cytochrome c oxidase cbb3-type subunit 2
MRSGLARQGEQIYKANGCNYCHSQQVRAKGFGSDVERGWGGRNGVVQSVDQDYLYDYPVMLGTQRVGPDLANIGLRQTNLTTLLLHIYQPSLTMPGSIMPPYPYLFDKHKLAFGEKASDDALPLSAETEAGYEVVPTPQARALAAYLLSLRSEAVLFEAPPFPPKTNSVAKAQTNAPVAAMTNAPAK